METFERHLSYPVHGKSRVGFFLPRGQSSELREKILTNADNSKDS